MAKTKISEYSTTAGNNTDINSINIAEGCAPSGINDAIRELMRQLKEFQTGGAGDSVNSGGDFSVATNKFTVASASGNTAVAGTLGVTGAATLSSTLAVTGTTTLTGALLANGNATLGDGSGDTVTVKGTPTLEVNPTLSGGTANGVLYLNGSKVATSGSALTFDGSSLGIGGAATSRLMVKTATDSGSVTSWGASQMTVSPGGGGTDTAFAVGVNTSTNDVYLYALAPSVAWRNMNYNAANHIYNISGSEQMRLTSTGLGIGTSSPSSKLHLYSASGTAEIIQDSATALRFIVNSGTNYIQSGAALSSDSKAPLVFTSMYGVTEWMRLDTSGNLGLGVTPSAWNSGYTAFQVRNTSIFTSGTTDLNFGQNVYINSGGNYTYISNGYATLYNQYAGKHFWSTAASGTAGDAITFTQAMTLDASNNLFLGTTSSTYTAANRTVMAVNGSVSGMFVLQSGSTDRFYILSSSAETDIGTSGATPLVFYTNGSERARIDSSGNLLVGTTSGTENRIFKSSSTYAARIENTSTSEGSTLLLQSGRSSGTGFTNIECYSNGSLNFQVLGNGNVQNTNNSYGAISDAKLKENVVDATPKLEKLNQVRVVNFNMIGSEQKQLGVIAQELESIFPGMVDESPDRDQEGNDLGTTTKSVKYSVFVPMLIKAIQEQQAQIESLRKRLADAGIA